MRYVVSYLISGLCQRTVQIRLIVFGTSGVEVLVVRDATAYRIKENLWLAITFVFMKFQALNTICGHIFHLNIAKYSIDIKIFVRQMLENVFTNSNCLVTLHKLEILHRVTSNTRDYLLTMFTSKQTLQVNCFFEAISIFRSL